MSDMTLQFRTAAVGGFQKKDVLEYIEQSNRTHADALESWKRKLDQEEQTWKDVEERLIQAQEELSQQQGYQEELETLKEEYQDQLAQLQAQLDQKIQRIAQLESEKSGLMADKQVLMEKNTDLEERLQVSEVNAKCYETIKERTAGMELEALRRAQIVENEAKAAVDAIWVQLEEKVQVVENRYQQLRGKMSTTTAQAMEDIHQIQETLEDLAEEFDGEDKRVAEILCQISAKEPVLLPLEE